MMQGIRQPIITQKKSGGVWCKTTSSRFYEKKSAGCWWPRSFTNRLAILKIPREETSHLHLCSGLQQSKKNVGSFL